MMLSKKQLAAFWRLWARAEAECLPFGADRDARDTFRRSVIRRVCGADSIKLVGPGRGYDRLMLEAAALAGDFEAAAHWCNGSERRTVFFIGECARQIGEIAGEPKGWDYCRGIFKQADLPPSWEDIPDHLLASVFQMLDTHRRRLLRRDHRWGGRDRGRPLGFNPARRHLPGARANGGLAFTDAPVATPLQPPSKVSQQVAKPPVPAPVFPD